MWPNWFVALLVMLKEAWSARRDAHIRFLKLQVEMLQSRLPSNRVILDPVERRPLMRIGAEAGHAVEDTLGIALRSILFEARMVPGTLKERSAVTSIPWLQPAGTG